jgi:hypothetical protein
MAPEELIAMLQAVSPAFAYVALAVFATAFWWGFMRIAALLEGEPTRALAGAVAGICICMGALGALMIARACLVALYAHSVWVEVMAPW